MHLRIFSLIYNRYIGVNNRAAAHTRLRHTTVFRQGGWTRFQWGTDEKKRKPTGALSRDEKKVFEYLRRQYGLEFVLDPERYGDCLYLCLEYVNKKLTREKIVDLFIDTIKEDSFYHEHRDILKTEMLKRGYFHSDVPLRSSTVPDLVYAVHDFAGLQREVIEIEMKKLNVVFTMDLNVSTYLTERVKSATKELMTYARSEHRPFVCVFNMSNHFFILKDSENPASIKDVPYPDGANIDAAMSASPVAATAASLGAATSASPVAATAASPVAATAASLVAVTPPSHPATRKPRPKRKRKYRERRSKAKLSEEGLALKDRVNCTDEQWSGFSKQAKISRVCDFLTAIGTDCANYLDNKPSSFYKAVSASSDSGAGRDPAHHVFKRNDFVESEICRSVVRDVLRTTRTLRSIGSGSQRSGFDEFEIPLSVDEKKNIIKNYNEVRKKKQRKKQRKRK